MAQATAVMPPLERCRSLAIRYKRIAVFFTMLFLVGAYTSFLTADIYALYLEHDGQKSGLGSLYSKWLKFACIVLCAALTALIGRHRHDARDRHLIQLAFALTVVADLLIGILGHFLAGVGVFFLVQLALIVRHARGWRLTRNEVISFFIVFGVATAIFVLIAPILRAGDLLIPGVAYFLVLTASVWIGVGTLWRTFFPRTIDWFIVVGMLLFFLCDTNVGLSAALEKQAPGTAAPAWTRFVVNPMSGRTTAGWDTELLGQFVSCLIWYFYLPAQTLLALSGYRVAFLRSIFPLIPDLPEPDESDDG